MDGKMLVLYYQECIHHISELGRACAKVLLVHIVQQTVEISACSLLETPAPQQLQCCFVVYQGEVKHRRKPILDRETRFETAVREFLEPHESFCYQEPTTTYHISELEW